jgi:hypothetical protein
MSNDGRDRQRERVYLTPPQYASKLGVHPRKVIGWIMRGELEAINVASSPAGRPRYRLRPADIAAFEQKRQAGVIPTKRAARRRTGVNVIEFF